MTLVSVVVPTYNRNELLFGRALASVLRQTHSDLDIHVVCDGMSGEELEDLERRAQALDDSRVQIWHIPRQAYPDDPARKWPVVGLNAKNHGLDCAVGDWVAPLDDDDEWTDDHVAVLLDAAVTTGVDFAYGMSQYHWLDQHPQTAGSWPPGFGAFCDGAQLYRNGMGYRYDPGCIERGLPQDADLWTRMIAGGVTFTFVPALIHHYWVNPR